MPTELELGGVYFPPMLMNGILAVAGAVLTAHLLNRFRLSRYFSNPPVVFFSLSIIYACLLSMFAIPA
jgi:hypothetical protein